MAFQDQLLPCDACGQTFVWTAGEQAFYEERGFTQPPRRCSGARKVRKSTGTTDRYSQCPFNMGLDSEPTMQLPPESERIAVPGRGIPKSGMVIKVLAEKGFGFVRDAEGQDYYFNRKDLCSPPFESLQEGLQVAFEAVPTSKGYRASRITQA